MNDSENIDYTEEINQRAESFCKKARDHLDFYFKFEVAKNITPDDVVNFVYKYVMNS